MRVFGVLVVFYKLECHTKYVFHIVALWFSTLLYVSRHNHYSYHTPHASPRRSSKQWDHSPDTENLSQQYYYRVRSLTYDDIHLLVPELHTRPFVTDPCAPEQEAEWGSARGVLEVHPLGLHLAVVHDPLLCMRYGIKRRIISTPVEI